MRPNNPFRKDKLLFVSYLFAPLFLIGVVAVAFPYFRYYIDPDATSYLTLVRCYVNGNYDQAINAFWSPMGCWLTALLVKATGYPLFTAAIIVNTTAAAGTIVLSQVLFFRFRKSSLERICFIIASVFFWSYAVYKQSFTDLWQYLFLLAGLLLLLSPWFARNLLYWIAAGIMGALAYYGKAFSFYFFPLMLLAGLWIRLRHEGSFSLKRWIGITGIAVLVMLACIAPWLYLLHNKYGIWTTSTAGTLNLSWWLTGHPEYRSDIKVLLPPPYPGSVFSFEDPYLIQGHFEHFWDSPRLLIKQMIRIGYNAINWVESCNILSPFYFITWLLVIIFLFGKRKQHIFLQPELKTLAVIFLLYPLAFWLMTFDNGRYLWVTLPLSMVLGLSMAEKTPVYTGKWSRRLFIPVFFMSYLAGIIPDMRTMFRTGEEEYKIAKILTAKGIKGSFVTNQAIEGTMGHYILRIAYFSECPLYCYGENKWTEEDIMKDAKRYGVKYFFYFHNAASGNYQPKDTRGAPLHEMTEGKIAGLKIFELP